MSHAPGPENSSEQLIHGTAIAVGGRAALLRGPSGSGKSDLALRCLFCSREVLHGSDVKLVSDDYVMLSRSQDRLFISAPETIRGQIEVRGLGLYSVACCESAELVLVADLVGPEDVERLPDPIPKTQFFGIALPIVKIAPFEASAVQKLMMALMYGVSESQA